MSDVFCKERAEMTEEKSALIINIKEKAEELHELFSKTAGRETSVALTNLEQAVMWAVKGVVKSGS